MTTTRDTETFGASVAPDSARSYFAVRVVFGPDGAAVGRLVPVTSPVTIGRTGHAEGILSVNDAAISRQHVDLVPSDSGLRLVDRGSHNGSFVGGARVKEADLAPNAVIRIGSTLLVVETLTSEDAKSEPDRGSALLGESVASQRLRRAISNAAKATGSVLVMGETGVGKEIVAAEVHRKAGRGKLVPLNCGALPEQLAEAELFGHAAGAFTGAQGAREGVFEAAEGGTLFLDEIGEMPLTLQPKLLRVLDTGEVRPVGSSKSKRVSARIVAATNRDLRSEVDAGRFRADLYARLATHVLRVLPLRERRADILLLARHFLDAAGSSATFDPTAAEQLLLHPFPFNVRELVSAIHGLVASGTTLIDRNALTLQIGSLGEAKAKEARKASREAPTADELRAALRETRGNIAEVAARFGRDRKQVYRWLERHSLTLEDYREPGES